MEIIESSAPDLTGESVPPRPRQRPNVVRRSQSRRVERRCAASSGDPALWWWVLVVCGEGLPGLPHDDEGLASRA